MKGHLIRIDRDVRGGERRGERRRERGKTMEEDVLITVVQFGFIYLFDKV